MILFRYLLICIIGYLVVRSFIRYGEIGKQTKSRPLHDEKDKLPSKKVSKGIGEYVEYEEIKKEMKSG